MTEERTPVPVGRIGQDTALPSEEQEEEEGVAVLSTNQALQASSRTNIRRRRDFLELD